LIDTPKKWAFRKPLKRFWKTAERLLENQSKAYKKRNQRMGQIVSAYKQIRPKYRANLPEAMRSFAQRPWANLLMPLGKSAQRLG